MPGDQLVIHGEYSDDQKIVTLAASDISEEGKTCYVSVEGVTPFEQKAIKSKFYIAYPGEFVSNPKHCMESSNFTNTNALLIAGYDKDKTFVLDYITGGVSFIVSGDPLENLTLFLSTK